MLFSSDMAGFIHAVMLDAITQRANYSAQLVRTNKLKVGGRICVMRRRRCFPRLLMPLARTSLCPMCAWQQEMAAGRALFHKFGDAEGPLTLGLMMIEKARIGLGIVDVTRGRYGGNTALLWHAGQFFALHEREQPHLLPCRRRRPHRHRGLGPQGRCRAVELLHRPPEGRPAHAQALRIRLWSGESSRQAG